jgi:hypothetical protein
VPRLIVVASLATGGIGSNQPGLGCVDVEPRAQWIEALAGKPVGDVGGIEVDLGCPMMAGRARKR